MIKSPRLDAPNSRNWVWRSIQLVLQNVFVFWFRYRIEGLEKIPQGGALLLINHQSFIDPLVVGVAMKRPISFLARDNLFRVPIIGWILSSTYVLPIRREGAGTESIRVAVDRLKIGYLVGLFPEGTRSTTGELQKIHPGFLAIAKRAQVPVVPVAVAGAIKAFPKGAVCVLPRTVRVVVGDPFSTEVVAELTQKSNEKQFLQLIQEELQRNLDRANSLLPR